jgi:HEAT repeat protein
MAKRLTTEDLLATLRQLRSGESSPATLASLEQLLHAPRAHGIVIKAAVELAHKWEARSLIPALVAAAEALSPDALGTEAQKRDPGCEGKEAILRALIDWEADAPDFYFKAAKWRQFAPIMNGSRDVAAECRGLAALGIAQTRGGTAGSEAALMLVIDLLADSESATRVRAAQALGMWRSPEAAPVLRLKAHHGDEDAQVLGETLASLLRHDPTVQLPFITGFLDAEDSRMVEAAALALGESHLIAALPALTAACDRLARDPVRTSVLMAVALLRHEDSLAWLLARLTSSRPAAALEVLEALRLYRADDKTVARIAQIAQSRPELARPFAEMFTQSV